MRIGFVGLGVMGRPMARNLIAAGHELSREALMGGFASSRILELHGERMVKETYDPGFRIRLHRKDLSLAIQAAAELNLQLPNTAATQQLMNAAIADGDGDLDHSALHKTLRRGRS